LSKSHLDLGCGQYPRNPYNHEKLFGLDTRALEAFHGTESTFEYRQCNFVLEKLPFPDQSLDSVSAFDVFEHIPRQIFMPGEGIIYPFISLMNELYRVLKPNGLLLASIPAFPHPDAFKDPTHVNIISLGTAEYFCGENPVGRMYGFTGSFHEHLNRFDSRANYFDRRIPKLRMLTRRIHHTLLKGGLPHIIWEFAAKK
jgi:SAM-dependent methyltransferase